MTVADLERALAALRDDGYALVGPRVRDGAVVVERIDGIADMPRGVGDEQAPGRYRLRSRADDALFGWAAGAISPKHELFAPRATLVQIRRGPSGPEVAAPARPRQPLAFVGIRPCDRAAIGVQDLVLDGEAPDPDYAARRAGAFFFVVGCGEPAATCFCASMATGPRATTGFDVEAVELVGERHVFVVRAGSARGDALVDRLGLADASPDDVEAARAVVASAAARMGRTLDEVATREALGAPTPVEKFADVASRCLGCANCTMACPTCFCSTIEDTTDLSGDLATRTRRWDSCFDADHAYVHGGSTRPSLGARYRQWLTHKLSSWHEQFGVSGCVGCGRCITFCPVGIDLTREAALAAAASREQGA